MTGRNDPKPAPGSYSPEIPKKTDAGEYIVWYEIRGAGEASSSWVYAEIYKKQWDTEEEQRKWNVSTNGLYGAEGMIDAEQFMPRGERPNLALLISDAWKVLKGTPWVDNPRTGAATMRVHYEAKRDEDLPASDNRAVGFTVSATQMKNYKDFDVRIGCYFIKNCPHTHTDTEPLHNEKVANCMEKGYTGNGFYRGRLSEECEEGKRKGDIEGQGLICGYIDPVI